MAKGLTSAEQAAKWAANAGAATQAYKNGISKVQSSPTAKAAQNLGKALTNYAQAVNNGTMAAKLQGVSTEQWKQAAIGKGATNYTTGITAGLPKMQAALAKWVPIRNSIADSVRSMPSDTYEQRKARATAMMDGMHAAKMQGV